MNKIFTIGSVIVVLSFLVLLFKPFKQKDTPVLSASSQPVPTQTVITSLPSGSEKIEVIHFHATQQCWSCITVGEYALKTIEEKFPEEFKNGTIVYKDVNGELVENREMVNKFKASGSSLFINAIKDGQDHIEEDVTVWRLLNNESQFIDYFESKLKKLL